MQSRKLNPRYTTEYGRLVKKTKIRDRLYQATTMGAMETSERSPGKRDTSRTEIKEAEANRKAMAMLIFSNSGLVAFSAYMLGIASVIVTGVMLKKTKLFAGKATPFVMELPAYHLPTAKNVWHSIWERLKSFMKNR